jgi:ABC-2 type transport system ATP-binding protein
MSVNVIVDDLRKRYGAVEAVRGVSFQVQEGEIFGLIGPNGAGKTTTVECVIGLREPDSGTIEVCGIDARRQSAAVREKIGAALQTTALQDKITPREALALYGSFYRRHLAPADLIARFALTEKADAPFDSLSGGQRQRLALALAFVNDPEVVLLDEPTGGLDPKSRRELHAEILKMRHDRRTVLLTTHDLEEAQALCDRVAIIDRGQVIALGAPRELMARSTATQSVVVVTAAPLDPAELRGLPGVLDVQQTDRETRLTSSRVTETVSALMQLLGSRRVELVDLRVQRASLEDVFLELTRNDTAGVA